MIEFITSSIPVTVVTELTNPQNTPTGDGATLTIDSNSDLGTLYSYSKTTPFTGTEADAAEIIANGVWQSPVIGTNTRVVTGQDSLTPHYAGWVQDSDGFDYYINASTGDDSNNGTDKDSAWASLNKVTNLLLVAGTMVSVHVAAGTYNTANDHILIESGANAVTGAVIDMRFDPGCVMDGTAHTTTNGVECSGDNPWTLNIHGTGLIIQNYDDAGSATPNGIGNRGFSIINAYDVDVIACADGFSSHGDATLNAYDCTASECSKAPFIHIERATVTATRCVFTEKVGGGSSGLNATDTLSPAIDIKCYDTKFIPDATGTTFLYNGELHSCELGTLTKSLAGNTAPGGITQVFDSFLNLYLDGNKTWTITRGYGRFSTRTRSGGAIDVQHSVITGAASGQAAIIYSNFNPGSGSKLVVNNNIFETTDTFMNIDANNSGYLVAEGSEFFNNMLPDGQTYDTDLVAADTESDVIQGEVFGDPLIGPANDYIMYNYGFTTGSPATGAGTTGNIGFSVDEAWGG